MLQSVRKYTQGWVATVMGIILSLAFMFWGIENYLGGSGKKNVIAKVNGKEITLSELNADFQRMVIRLKEQTGANFNLPPLMQQELKSQALNNIIMEDTLEQAAFKSGFRVTPEETRDTIKQMPLFLENGSFSKDRFELAMAKLGYSQQEFFSEISKSLLLNQVASGVIGSAFILPSELDQAIALVEQKRDLEYVLIPAAMFKKEVKLSAEQIKIYYMQHKNQLFKIPAKLQIDYVLLSTKELKNNIKVSEQELNIYFNSNTDLDRKNPKAIAKARETLVQQKSEQAFLAASDKLTDLAFTNPNSLADAANALNLKVNTSEYFSQQGGSTPITKHPKIIAAAFNPEILKDKINSNIIELSPGNIVVLRVKDFKPETVAPLTEVQDKIKRTLTDMSASLLAKEKGKNLIEKMKNKSDFAKVIAAEHLTLVAKQHASRHEKNISPDILRLAFSTSPSSEKPVGGIQLANGDCVIVMVKSIINFDTSQITDQQRNMMTKLYSDTYGKLDYNLYVEHQMDKARIKTYVSHM